MPLRVWVLAIAYAAACGVLMTGLNLVAARVPLTSQICPW